MSADNWAMCPRCVAQADKRIHDAYGKASLEEFDKLRNQRKNLAETFREDYEIGVYDNRFYIDYRGACSTCGLQHNFKHEEHLTIEVPA